MSSPAWSGTARRAAQQLPRGKRRGHAAESFRRSQRETTQIQIQPLHGAGIVRRLRGRRRRAYSACNASIGFGKLPAGLETSSARAVTCCDGRRRIRSEYRLATPWMDSPVSRRCTTPSLPAVSMAGKQPSHEGVFSPARVRERRRGQRRPNESPSVRYPHLEAHGG